MSASETRSGRRAARLLELLETSEGRLEGSDGATLRFTGPNGLRRMRLEPEMMAELIAEGLIRVDGDPADRVVLTTAGRARARRGRRLGEVDGFRLQHGDVAPLSGCDPTVVDRAESPLAWLARRRDRSGRAYLSPARVAAGERLRADFTLARMMPTVTSNWSSGRVQTGGAGAGGLADLTDRALAARERVHRALDAAGTDLAGVLLDVCCFLKGLEEVESDRRWPVRSAKVVLDIALGRLADHYGLGDEARGADRSGRLRAWGSGDHRPSATRATPD